MISKDLQLLNPVDRRVAVLRLLAGGLWCPSPEPSELVEEGFIGRLRRAREANRAARIVIGSGYESRIDDEVLWPYLWRAGGWAQQNNMESWIPGRPFCRHWRNQEYCALVVRSVCGETGVDLGKGCVQGLVSFAVLRTENGHMLVHLSTTEFDISPRDSGALEASATQVMRSMSVHGGGAGVLSLSVALGRPSAANVLTLPDSGLALAFAGLNFKLGEALSAAIDDHRA